MQSFKSEEPFEEGTNKPNFYLSSPHHHPPLSVTSLTQPPIVNNNLGIRY